MSHHKRDYSSQNFNQSLSNETENLHQDWMYRDTDGVLFPAILNSGSLEMSTRVAFASSLPTLPPTHGNIEKLTLRDILNGSEKFKIPLEKKREFKEHKKHRRNKKSRRKSKKRKQRKHRHGHGKRRRRSHRTVHYESPISSCTDYSDWVQVSQSLNQWEQPVIVLPYIEIKGRTMQQYFYETNCVREESSCVGIDKRHYKSECVTKKILTYAYVRHPTTGEESWSYIKINGSCNCKLQRKVRHVSRNILDVLSSHH